MQSIIKTLIVLCILTLVISPKVFSANPDEIGENFDKSKREEWINNARGGNDGINWKLIDNETRKSKYDLLKREANTKRTNSLQSEFIANGKIEGAWIEKGSNNNAGRIRGVDLDLENELIYAISDGGNVFRGTLEGKDWTCLNNSIKFDNPHIIKVLKFNGKKRILAVTYGDKLSVYSDDEGLTWNISNGLDNPKRWGAIRRCVVANDENQTIYLLGHEWDFGTDWKAKVVIYYSKDHGTNYERILFEEGNSSMMDLWAEQYDTDKVFYFKADSIFTLHNGNISFLKKFDINLVNSPSELTATGSSNDSDISFILCIRSSSNNTNNFLVSYDEGDSWELRGSLDKNKFMMTSFATSTFSVDFAYLGNVDLYMSNDGGYSWNIRNSWVSYYQFPETMLHADIPAVQFFRTPDDQEIMFISTDGGLYKSDDYGSNVKNISLYGLNVSQYYSVLTAQSDPNIIYVGAQDQGFQRANLDSGKTLGFDQLYSGDYGSISSTDEGNSLWSVYPYFVLYMQNAPIWNKTLPLKTWYFEGGGWHWMTPTRALNNHPYSAYSIGGDVNNGSYLWRFYASGEADMIATKLSRNFRSEATAETLIALELSKTNKVFCASNKGIMHITENGEQWEDYYIFKPINEGDQPFYASYIAIDPTNENTIFVGGRGYNTPGAYVSFDGGQTYQAINEGLPNTYINGMAVSSDGKLVFAATSVGPYVFVTWMNRWYSMATLNSPDQDFRWVEYVPSSNTARFATYGRGIWDFKIENIYTNIEEKEKPINFEVRAYPNPMNEKTTIEFNIPVSGFGTVKIFDIEGHEITKLQDGFIQAGNHSYIWNGLNSSSVNVNNSTYLCLVTVSGFTAYIKIEINK